MTGTELKHRLAAILAADAAGYSRLMAADERGTVTALDAARTVFRKQVESNQGRVVDTAGDSVLAVFDTAAGATVAALAIQTELVGGAQSVPPEQRLLFRVGLHLGDVIEKTDGTIYGDGVNIAARLQALAEPGAISVSESIRSAVKGKVNASFEDQGEQQVKNIAEPVRAYRVKTESMEASSAKHSVADIDLSLPDKPSIAILPFTNMSGDPEQEYFSDGVSEDIITELSRFHSLFVIARNSSFTYKGKAVDVRNVGKELGVRYVLEGSIRRSANRIRVTAQLIDALTGKHIWAEKYDRVLEDIFAVQEELTASIVNAIAPKIDEVEITRVLRRRPADLSAYERAMRSRGFLERAFIGKDHVTRSLGIEEARSALAIDAHCVLALQMLAYGRFQEIWAGGAMDRRAAWEEAMEAAARSIELDRTDSFGYAARAALLALSNADRHLNQALDDARHARQLNPNDFKATHQLAWIEMICGEHVQAVQHAEQALRINPRDPWSFSVYAILADAYFFLREYARGLDCGLRGVALAQGAGTTYHDVALCYVGLGELAKAREAFSLAKRASPDFVNAVLSGSSVLRRPGDRKKYTLFLRIAADLEDASAADSLR